MEKLSEIGRLNHRSVERIKVLGEVFTPENYVEEMLKLISHDESIWSDLNVVFFEPCCGHGNIVVPIIRKRIQSIYKIALGLNLKTEAAHFTIANTLNTFWAIDIDEKNVHASKTRVLNEIIIFMREKTKHDHLMELIVANKDFFAHVVCAINWHISQNETLAALSSREVALESAKKTNLSLKWYHKNGHRPLDFEKTWCEFYENQSSSNIVPNQYLRAVKMFDLYCGNKSIRGFDEFGFVKQILEAEMSTVKPRVTRKVLEV